MKTQLNGQTIPHDKPTDELLSMLRCADMQSFCLACEALSARGETAALTPFLQSGDRWQVASQQYLGNHLLRHAALGFFQKSEQKSIIFVVCRQNA